MCHVYFIENSEGTVAVRIETVRVKFWTSSLGLMYNYTFSSFVDTQIVETTNEKMYFVQCTTRIIAWL